MRRLLLPALIVLLLPLTVTASPLYVGNDTQSPVSVYTPTGVFVQDFGQNGATGSALDAVGNVWTVAPAFGNNHVVQYDSAQNVLNSFTATINGQWVEDMSHGTGSTLYLGTFEGNVFAVNDQTGAILSSFAVANSTFTGVAFDGTNLWTSGGLTSQNLFQYTTGGTLLATFPLGNTCGGVGFDASDGTLWCGDFGVVRHYSTAGALLGSFNTLSGAYHDGLEVANLDGAVSTVPEPSTLLLLGTGLTGLLFGTSRRRRVGADPGEDRGQAG